MSQGKNVEQDRDYGETVLAIAVSAFLLRVISIFVVEPSLTSDPLMYHNLARSLLENGTYTLGGTVTAYRPPGYPFFLAALYALPGSDILAVRLVQSMVDALVCVLVFRLGRRIYSSKEGVAAAVILAVYTPYILYSQALFSETLFTFLLLLLLDSLVSRSEERGGAITAGILLGLGTFLKPVMIIFPAILVLWNRLRGDHTGRALKRALLVSLFLVITVSPWLVRNRVSLGEWVFTTNGGVNLWIGNNPAATGAYGVPEVNPVFEEEDEIARNKLAFDEAVGFWKENPQQALKILPWKFFFFFSSESALILNFFEDTQSAKVKRFAARYLSVPVSRLLVFNLPYYLLLLLSLPSLILERKADGEHTRSLLFLTIIFWIAVHLVFFGSNRFHMPVMALLSVFAARTLVSAGKFLDSDSGFRKILFLLSFLFFITLWIGEWVGLLLSLRI